MSVDKDIRFTEKKIDDSWKEQANRDKDGNLQNPLSQSGQPGGSAQKDRASQSSKPFLQLLSSLAYQAMMHLGEIPHPETRKKEIQLEAAREVIDLLVHLQAKTEGNTSPEERDFFQSVLADLQMKFAEKV